MKILLVPVESFYDNAMRKSAAIIFLGLAFACPSAKADEADRLAAEARALFPAVLADEPPAQQCGYDAVWQNDAIPDYIAAKYFGLRVHAGLSPPEQTNDLQAILDPTGRQPAAFCSDADLADYEEARYKAMKDDASSSSMEITTRHFTFPVFDADYKTAILVVTGRRDTWYRADKQTGSFKRGDVGRAPPDVASVAKVFRKTPKGWKLIGV